MTKTSRLVVVCALSVLAFRCSTNDSGLGVKYDAAPGGARDAAADRPAQTGGASATGGGVGTGGMVASGGVSGTGGRGGAGGAAGTGGRTGTGGATATGGRTGTGGATATGGRTGSGGTVGAGGTQGRDAGPGCSTPDAGTGCCYLDQHCPSGQECVGGACNTSSAPGICKTATGLASGQCWRSSDCPSTTPTCQGASVCPCGAACFAADKPGTCQ
jgi:two-component system chemotaxis sensor kinase CheA